VRRVGLFALLVAWNVACKSNEATAPADAGPDSSVESCYEAPTNDDRAVFAAKAPLIQYVDPFIGTGGVGFGIGSTFPGPQTPFGLARPGPDTMGTGGAPTFSHCVGYAYEDNFIYGFSQSRLHGIGIVDAGAVGMMPVNGAVNEGLLTEKGRRVGFNHKNEKASPGYYSVTLDNGIKAELTATPHVAYHRYTMSEGVLLIDIGHELPTVKIVDGSVTVDAAKQEISGFAHYSGGYSDRFGGVPMYFVAKVSAPFDKSGTWKTGVLSDAQTQTGGDTGAWINAKGTFTVAVALSFVDIEHAKKNLAAETMEFDAARTAAESAWEAALSRVQIEARSARDLEIGYTALYHTLLMPTLGSDVDGSYRGLDNAVHVATGYRYYTDFSLWDTYRTLHPFLNLVYPEYQLDFLRSMSAMAKEGQAPPKWVLGIGETQGMVGDSAAVVFSDSYLKGIRDFDVKGAYDVLKKSANGPLPKNGRSNIKEYVEKGYIPIEAGSSSGSSTLEYAYDDFALAQLADALGEKADAEVFRKRSGNWKNLWDSESGLILGRNADGSFPRNDDHLAWAKYWAEGTTWHYTWFVPHDLPGLNAAMGGKLLDRLDSYFALSSCQSQMRLAPKPYYWHSNEPVLFVPWIYAELDAPERGARWVRWALANEYNDTPDGLPGNDDGGTMSAWYLFAAMGIFPRVAATDYVLGMPIFPKTTLKLPGGTLVITAPETSSKNMVPKSFTWNGSKLARPRIEHSELAKGGALQFSLSAQ
jgi:predicted alpha-1,2-mannosidase